MKTRSFIVKSTLPLAVITAFTTSTLMPSAVNAAPAKNTSKTAKSTAVYTCAHHPNVVQLKPGKCPACKMTLQKKNVSAVYTCAHHPKVVSLKPGTCPACKMKLTKRKS